MIFKDVCLKSTIEEFNIKLKVIHIRRKKNFFITMMIKTQE